MRTYEQPHSLFVLRPGQLVRCGELYLAVRFTHTAWVIMMLLYLRPTLPNQRFTKPIPTHLLQELRRATVEVIASRLVRAEPPPRPEAVHYLLRDPYAHPSSAVPEDRAYSKRRSLAACARLRDGLAPLESFARWLRGIRDWKHPPTTATGGAAAAQVGGGRGAGQGCRAGGGRSGGTRPPPQLEGRPRRRGGAAAAAQGRGAKPAEEGASSAGRGGGGAREGAAAAKR
jgi:hypothetical protein